ncbi:MAG: hypothetical protein SGI92_23265 [Bryobacteraceae bacterium]|nr:hypothetical protein [Bryobacteraceae bacterium]
MLTSRTVGVIRTVVCLILAAAGAHAAVTQVTAPAALAANRRLLRSQFGPDGTEVSLGFQAALSVAPGNTETGVSGSSAGLGWGKSTMPAGASVLWTSDDRNGGNGPVTITLQGHALSIGAWIEANAVCPPAFASCDTSFTAEIEVIGTNGSPGKFSRTSNSAGGAVFLGAASDQANVDVGEREVGQVVVVALRESENGADKAGRCSTT